MPGSPLAAPEGRFEPLGSPKSSNRPESLNLLFPQACVIRESFPRPFAIPRSPSNPSICHTHTSRRQVEDLQVVGAARSVDKSTGFKTGRRQPQTTRKACTKEPDCVKSPSRGSLIRQHRRASTMTDPWRHRSLGAASLFGGARCCCDWETRDGGGLLRQKREDYPVKPLRRQSKREFLRG